MDRRAFLARLTGSLAAPKLLPARAARPNIVLIVADDMGFSDLACYGGELETPNLDRLAKSGIRFTQFYNTARCCPTRASLLTGLYPHQAGVGHMVDTGRPDLPGYRGDLNRNCVTIAEVLRDAGYHTLMVGKWHVTPVSESKHNWPLQRGFERYYGTIHGAGSYYDPVMLVRDNERVEPDRADFYYTDALGRQAAKWIEDYVRRGAPFFLYVAFTAPHWPLHAPADSIAKYRGRFRAGWDELRRERYRRMVRMGLLDPRWSLTARDSRAPAWESVSHRDWQMRRMEVYAAMVEHMDRAVGAIVGALRRVGAEADTLLLFLSDNGGCAEEIGPQWRGLHIPKATRAGQPVVIGNLPHVLPGPENTYQSYGVPWANLSNTPFRLFKHWVHEGGIATPLIAHWPRGIAKPGSVVHQPGHVIDLMATCVDVAAARYPETYLGQPITPLEGKSLVPVFQGRNPEPRGPLFWEHEGNRAVREGRWKLVSRYPEQWELYDLEADRTETNDLSRRHPDVAERLARLYQDWARRCGVEPWENVRKRA